MRDSKQEYLGVTFLGDEGDKERIEKARERESSFNKSEDNDDLIKKRVGFDLFKGGNN